MVQLRKLALAVVAASSLGAGAARALEVGEVNLKSALNQPLLAEIQLLGTRDLSPEDLAVRLAPPEAYSNAGVEHSAFLNSLRFKTVFRGNGRGAIVVTSSQPVREPYLDFLVQVTWPSGRIMREYTVLLDPPFDASLPTAAASVVPAVSSGVDDGPPLGGGVSTPRYAPAAAFQAQPGVPRRSQAPKAKPASRVALSQSYRTKPEDTLWSIARRVEGGGSVRQTMLAIQDLNRGAFINGDINRLKVGQVLQLPDLQQIRDRSGAAVAQQKQAVPPVPQASDAPSAADKDGSQDSLRLSGGDTGTAAGKGVKQEPGAEAGAQGLSDKLAATEESLESVRREKGDLQNQVSELQAQVDQLKRLVQLKDQSLAVAQGGDPVPDAPAKVAEAALPAAETATEDASADQVEQLKEAARQMQEAAKQLNGQEGGLERLKKPESGVADATPLTQSSAPGAEQQSLAAKSTANLNPVEKQRPDSSPVAQSGASWLLWLLSGLALILILGALLLRSRAIKQKARSEAAGLDRFRSARPMASVPSAAAVPEAPLSENASRAPAAPVVLSRLSEAPANAPEAPLLSAVSEPVQTPEAERVVEWSFDRPQTADSSEQVDDRDYVSQPAQSAESQEQADAEVDQFLETANSAKSSQDSDLDWISLQLEPVAPSAKAVNAPDSAVFEEGLSTVDGLDFTADSDEVATKLDLARAYLEIGDTDGAHEVLIEVLAEGTEPQQSEARKLIQKLG